VFRTKIATITKRTTIAMIAAIMTDQVSAEPLRDEGGDEKKKENKGDILSSAP
jgi:hypothetical protein